VSPNQKEAFLPRKGKGAGERDVLAQGEKNQDGKDTVHQKKREKKNRYMKAVMGKERLNKKETLI